MISTSRPNKPTRWCLIIPFILFTGIVTFLYFRLYQPFSKETSASLLNKPFPSFSLPLLHQPETRYTEKMLQGQVTLVNIWATWDFSCRLEYPFWIKLAHQHIPIIGINYKNSPATALQWMHTWGNPFIFSLEDEQGTLSTDLGIYEIPATLLIDASGHIRFRHIGAVDEQIWQEILQPKYNALLTQHETAQNKLPPSIQH